MKTMKNWVAAATMLALSSAAYAAPLFQGRLADGTASDSCTASGAGKCTSFYFSTLDITILNNWNIGNGFWSATAAAGSAQAIAASAGLAATGLDGWVLPTGDGVESAGDLNQYRSIFNAVGNSLTGLQNQFDGVLEVFYWSRTEESAGSTAWTFFPFINNGGDDVTQSVTHHAVAVRSGDVVVASVPEPQTLALALLALGATGVASRARRR
jgi:hypothetical protein